ncbi:hypothetical protein Tco_1253019 [Tanacetum coccineum]
MRGCDGGLGGRTLQFDGERVVLVCRGGDGDDGEGGVDDGVGGGGGPRRQETMRDTIAQTSDEVLAELEVVVKDFNLTIDEVTLAQALAALKSIKPKERNCFIMSGTSTTTTTVSSQPSQAKVQDKSKGIMVEEPVKSMKKKDLVRLDEEIASKLQAEFDEEERLTREKDEANFTTEQKATFFKELLKQRRKHFAAKRTEEKRNKPPKTKYQQRKKHVLLTDNMEGKKPKDLKNKSFDFIQKMFDKAFKRVAKKQKVDDVQETAEVDNDQEAAKIKELMEIIPDKEEVAIDAIPLAVKPPSISSSYVSKAFDMEDLETLWKLVKAKHGSTRPEEGYKRVLWGDLRVMFEPHVEDTVWRNQQDYRVLEWKLHDSCGLHFLRIQKCQILYVGSEKYHLTPAHLLIVLNKKLQCDHFSEMAYQLLKLLTKQLKNQ